MELAASVFYMAKTFAVLFTVGFVTTVGIWSACRMMKWAPVNITVNIHNNADDGAAAQED